MAEHFDGIARPADRHVDIRPQKLDIVLYRFGNGTVNPFQRLQSIVELILLKLNACEPERSFVSYGIIHGPFEHPLDSAPSAVVHSVIELEITNGEFGIIDVIVESIEFRLVQVVVLSEFGVESLDCFEILSLVGVIERFAKEDILDVGIASKGRMGGKSQRQAESN